MKILRRTLLMCTASLMLLSSASVEAQTQRALERRAERNARQLQRQVNRGVYYTPQAWQQIDPWVREYEVAPIARAATVVRDGRFGFRDESQQNAWFYDYYTYTPTYYVPQTENRYAEAIRYFDADSDGLFDSRVYYRDSDDDGRYDVYDRLDFYAQAETDARVEAEARDIDNTLPEPADDSRKRSTSIRGADSFQGPQDSRRHTVEGEIASTKAAQVNGEEHLLVGLKQNDETLAIDLGLASNLKGRDVEVGTPMVAVGALEVVGEKDLLVADRFRIGDGEWVEIGASLSREFAGELVDVKTVPIGSTDYYMAIVDGDGERRLIDLGPTSTYQFELQPSTKIVFRGVPVRAQNHQVIMVENVEIGGEVFRINRTHSF